MPGIKPFLWFASEAEEAAQHYVSIFPNAKIERVVPGPEGSVIAVDFQLDGQAFTALNGRPSAFTFTDATSFAIDCTTQDEVDHYWSALSGDGGSEGQCGWLKDKFGVSWQVVPRVLVSLLFDPDPAKSQRVLQAMLPMKKLDIATLERAHAGT